MFNVQFIKYVEIIKDNEHQKQLQFERKMKSPIEPKLGWMLMENDFVGEVKNLIYDVRQSVFMIPVEQDVINVPEKNTVENIVERMKEKYITEGWSFVAEKTF